MYRNSMLILAMLVGMVGIFAGDPRFFFAGGLIALTTIFMRFKNTNPPARTRADSEIALDHLDTELKRLDDLLSSYCLEDDTDGPDGAVAKSYMEILRQKSEIQKLLGEIIKKGKLDLQ